MNASLVSICSIFNLKSVYVLQANVTLSHLRSKGFLVLKSDAAQFASPLECSNELPAHLAVQHLDVALPRVLTTY